MKHIRHLAAAAALLAAGGSAAIAADVKVGSAAGITGPIEGLVPPILAGRNLAATHVNEQGGILGGGTYMLVPGDSQCNPKAAVDAGTKLVNVEQVVAVIGPSCSGATNGMAQSVTIPAGVVTLSDSATAPMISFLEDGDLVFRAAPSDGYQSSALARFAWDAGLRKIAVTYANDDYNAGLGEAFVAAFEQIGGTITGKQAHEPDRQSYRSELSTLAGGGADALAVFAYFGGSGITILRNSLENARPVPRGRRHDGQLGHRAARGRYAFAARSRSRNRPRRRKAIPDPVSRTRRSPRRSWRPATSRQRPTSPTATTWRSSWRSSIEKAGGRGPRARFSAALREVANAPGMVIRPGEWQKAREAIAAGEDINYEGASGAIEFDENGTSRGRPTPSTGWATTGPGRP